MAGKNQHVVPHQGDWAVKGAGNQKATSVHSTQQEAVDVAREIARNQHSELIIHKSRAILTFIACESCAWTVKKKWESGSFQSLALLF